MGDEQEVKIGAEISRANHARIQAAHDTMVEMGATCKDPSRLMLDGKTVDTAETVVNFGGSVKAVQIEGGWKFKAPLVVFTNPNDLDLTGDYFDASTDFDMEFPGKSTTYFNHGMDGHFKRHRLEPATLTKDEFAVWAEGILHEADEYENLLIELGKNGRLGMSSGVPGHLVEAEMVGKAQHITYWPLGKDASYTHTPAEPKTRYVVPLKSLIIGETPQEPDGALVETVTKTVDTTLLKEGNSMPEFTEDQLKALISDAYKAGAEEVKRAEPATVTAGANITVVKDAADQPMKAAEFFQAVKVAGIDSRLEDPRLRPLKAAAGMNELNPADGGYLVPPAVAGGIYQNMLETGEILSRVNMTPVTGNSMTWNIVDETSHASTLFGGVIGYWLPEAGTKTPSAPKFRQLELKLKKVAALAYATDELLADANALQSWITTNVPNVLRWQVEDAFINGGVGKPLGILQAPGLLQIARETGSSITFTDITKMYARRLGNGPYVWLVNRTAMVPLMGLAGTYQYLWLPPGGLTGKPNAQLLGFPVIESEHMPALGTMGDIVLADLKTYMAIQKGGIESASSIHVKFTSDETAFRFVYRVDAAPILNSVITPQNGDTQAPFVALTAAS